MADPFPKADRRTPASIGEVRVTMEERLYDQEPFGRAGRRLRIDIVPLDANGAPLPPVSADLANHLTTQQKTTLNAFMDAMVTKAQETLLP